jgi:type I restriction-modification system DNA methylase subunit
MNKFNKIFERLATINDRSIIWNQFLDYCININLLNSKEKHLDFKGNEEYYAEMLGEWLLQLNEDLETKPYSDRLGMFYEELVTSHSKSKHMGQFYTPSDVTNLMNGLIINENSTGMVNDCACGSARMLLSAHVKSKGNLICIGQDLDEVSCKMAVLNFWSHGVIGSIIHQNTLSLEYYQAWRVNNYLYHGLPIPHIELVSEREAYHFIGVKTNETKPIELNKTKETVQTKLM